MRSARLALVAVLSHCVRAQILPPATQSVDTLLNQTFDYIIAGGGTAGLTLGVLLSQNSSISVLVLDKGTYRQNDTLIQAPGLWTAMLGNATYDYTLLSVPQPQANNAIVEFSRGKTLGGTSALNSMVYMPPSKHEFDAVYPTFGGPDWTWDNFMAFARMSEHYTPAASQFASADNAQQNASLHGATGPLAVAYANYFPNLVPPYFQALNTLGVPVNPDPRASGTNVGTFSAVINVDPTDNQRSYAVSAFYEPNKARANLVVMTTAQVNRVLFSPPGADGNVTATGVEFLFENTTHTANATQRVVLAAGVHFTPQILELSGIGNKTFLATFNITSVVDLPGVGENMQEHFAFNTDMFLTNNSQTFDMLRDPTFGAEQLADYIQNRTGLWGAGETAVAFVPCSSIVNASFIADLQAQITASLPSVSPAQQAQYKLVSSWMTDNATGWAEVFPQFEYAGAPGAVPPPTEPVISMTTLMEHPLSRGSVHINSTDPSALPLIDPQIYAHPVDRAMALATMRWLRETVVATAPLSGYVTGLRYPAANATDDDLFAGLLATVITGHTIGTAAMMPHAMGGVVDSDLKVYGTNNLFVVDTSVLPMEVSSHLDAFAYTLAYRTAAFFAGNSTAPAGATGGSGGSGGSGKSSADSSRAPMLALAIFAVAGYLLAGAF